MPRIRNRLLAASAGVVLAIGGLAVSAAPSGAAAPGVAGPHGIDVERVTIPELQRAMNSGRLSSADLTRFYLDRINRVDRLLHSVITVNPDARRLAAESDRRRAAGGARGPLEGIPVLLKDNINTGDRQPTTAGSLALLHSDPDDAFLVTRLRAAGAVILGKANLSEWANFRSIQSASGWSAVGGQTNNPYVLDRNPCGSSSGSGAAVAAHLATVAIGTETDGSIVCPSGANGIVGLKPSIGVVSRTGVVPISAAQDTAGPMTRNVTDTAVLLGVLAAEDPDDPATAQGRGHTFRDYTRFLDATALRGARIGVWRSGNTGASNETDAIFDAAVARLRALGATVVDPVDPPGLDQLGGPEFAALLTEFKHDLNAYLADLPGRHPRTLAELIEFNRANARAEMPFFLQEIFEFAEATTGDLTDPEYLEARRTATRIARTAIDGTLAEHRLDAIVAPTGSPAWTTDVINGDHFLLGSSSPAAVAGYPNITVPMGMAFELPVGISFIGARFDEPGVLALGYAFEQGTRARRVPRFLRSSPDVTRLDGVGTSAAAGRAGTAVWGDAVTFAGVPVRPAAPRPADPAATSLSGGTPATPAVPAGGTR